MCRIQIPWQRYVNMLCHGQQSSIKMRHGVVVLLVSDHISLIHSDILGILRQIVSVPYPFTKVDTYNFVLRPSQCQICFFHLVIVVFCFEPSSVKSDRGCIFFCAVGISDRRCPWLWHSELKRNVYTVWWYTKSQQSSELEEALQAKYKRKK